jgi:hypothetical protein
MIFLHRSGDLSPVVKGAVNRISFWHGRTKKGRNIFLSVHQDRPLFHLSPCFFWVGLRGFDTFLPCFADFVLLFIHFLGFFFVFGHLVMRYELSSLEIIIYLDFNLAILFLFGAFEFMCIHGTYSLGVLKGIRGYCRGTRGRCRVLIGKYLEGLYGHQVALSGGFK